MANMSSNDFLLELVKNRRSIRSFKPDPIPDEYIHKIIEVARWAPSGANLQPWEFVVVKDKELKEKIVQFCRTSMENTSEMETTREKWQLLLKPGSASPPLPKNQNNYPVAPVFILLYGDSRTNIGLPMYRRYNKHLEEEAFRGGLASAFLYMQLAASSLGLASQWVSQIGTPFANCMIKNLLGIPAELEPYDMMAVGYPAAEPTPRVVRTQAEITHYDHSPESFRTADQVKDSIQKIRGSSSFLPRAK